MGSIITPRVVRWAAQECAWQKSGELSVSWMVDAWMYAHRKRYRPITLVDVLNLGEIIEPWVNRNGFRYVPVEVSGNLAVAPALVSAAMHRLIELQPDLRTDHTLASEFFREFEEIHPFEDGNGRTGAILFNWIKGTLREPEFPPNLWRDPARDKGY